MKSKNYIWTAQGAYFPPVEFDSRSNLPTQVVLHSTRGTHNPARRPVAHGIRVCVALLFWAAFLSCAWGQDSNAIVVTGAFSDLESQSNLVALNHRLTLHVENLSNLVSQAIAERKALVPYIAGQELKEIYPESVDILRNELRFHLQRNDANRDAWAALLGGPKHFMRKVSVSVGPEGTYPAATSIEGIAACDLVVIRSGWLSLYVALLAVFLAWFFASGKKSPMLRDPGPEPGGGNLRPYSLAKTQMAFWFCLILFSFILIWAITGAYDTLTDSVLVLMGIGAGTALGVAVQNQGKEDSSDLFKALDTLEQQRKTLIAEGAPTDYVDAQIAATAPCSEGFLKDILTDARGLSLHRFQMAVWTLVLGIIFLKEVFCNLAMPEFNSTLLGLMGISSGTYLGFMIPEKHSIEQTAPQPKTEPSQTDTQQQGG